MKLLEPASAALLQKIRRHLHPGEEELIRIASDLSDDGACPGFVRDNGESTGYIAARLLPNASRGVP
ncbi:hypothetical protein EPO44_20820 [bacterium]|nr:MAG: hypothetical protein EPO44_20820 [bacterium]